ncbi:hypothetical protein GCK72_011232 [Caenorhabditis remanei]|uniref:Uncharacterized protein n=1 Tax=Caenorhabditis remanei TaxID=31234 RepID=A0A6A5H701_CAERE|nr:hypothetical protein GCK72_011232 [Caenorhabditis remanei]KAF1762967.1 hypothetical protein GCK72_011232 [Caenorhabditis remanei]
MTDRKRNVESDSGGGSKAKSKREAKKPKVIMVSPDFEEKVFKVMESDRFKKVVQRRLEDFLGERIQQLERELEERHRKLKTLEDEIKILDEKVKLLSEGKYPGESGMNGGSNMGVSVGGLGSQKKSEDPGEMERRRSVVVAGVPEYGGNDRMRWAWDNHCIGKVFHFLDIGAPPVSIYRLGKAVPGRSRLLKVVLTRSWDQQTLLARASRLRYFPCGSTPVYVRPSLTKSQREELRNKQKSNINVPVSTNVKNNSNTPHSPQPPSSSPTTSVPQQLVENMDTGN